MTRDEFLSLCFASAFDTRKWRPRGSRQMKAWQRAMRRAVKAYGEATIPLLYAPRKAFWE